MGALILFLEVQRCALVFNTYLQIILIFCLILLLLISPFSFLLHAYSYRTVLRYSKLASWFVCFSNLTFSLIFTEDLQVETSTLDALMDVSMNGSIGVNIYSLPMFFKIPGFSF